MSANVSYRLSQEHNAQSILWDGCGLIVATVRSLAAIVGRVAEVVSHFLPLLLIALGLTLALAAVVAVVACIPVQLWVGLLIVAAYAWVFKPSSKAVRQ